MPIRGTTNEPSTVTVNGNPAIVKADNSFEGKSAVTAGDNMVTVVATDVNGNTTTNRYNVAVTGSGSRTLVYDANGNLTSDGIRTFEWDPLNRLTAVTSGTHRSEFTYNGLNERAKIVEKDNGSVTSTKQFVWCPGDTQPCEERDGSNAVTKRFYAQGEQIGSTSYYYTKDHLGSTREMTDSSGMIHARYDYDPYGRLTKVQGDLDSDFTYAGYYNHSLTGLFATLNRFYDPDLGRWISRDPIGESGGINLYSYVVNEPIGWTDPEGLDVFVGDRGAVFSGNPLQHTAIVLRPSNPADFANDNFFKNNQATLGAQPSGVPNANSLYGNLVSTPNNPDDDPCKLKNLRRVPTPPGMTDSEFIKALISAANSYKDNLPYDTSPAGRWYNSNSYTSGVVKAAGATPPSLPGSHPGYNHPIPLP
jgi:RHS repeat-associated protein